MRPQRDSEPRRNRDGVFVGRDAISTMWKGMRARSVGSRIWFRPPAETFHSFLVRAVLASAFGPEWIAKQWVALKGDVHPVVRWMKRFEAVGVRPSAGSDRLADGTVVTDPDGALQALLCLSYDLYSVQHSAAVPAALMARLRHPDQFQGARYELSVAAIFARVGFDIEWIPPGVEPAPEFVARHRGKGPAIAVEAKSKHRPGGLGMAGSSQSPADIRIGIIRLLVDAIRKAPREGPFVVFVDLNLPPGAHGEENRLGALQEEVARLRRSDLLVPEPWSAMFVTNYAWHWDEEGAVPGDAPHFVVPEWAHAPLDLRWVEVILEATSQYVFVPNEE